MSLDLTMEVLTLEAEHGPRLYLSSKEAELLIRGSNHYDRAHLGFGGNRVWLYPVAENVWAYREVRKMREVVAAGGTL